MGTRFSLGGGNQRRGIFKDLGKALSILDFLRAKAHVSLSVRRKRKTFYDTNMAEVAEATSSELGRTQIRQRRESKLEGDGVRPSTFSQAAARGSRLFLVLFCAVFSSNFKNRLSAQFSAIEAGLWVPKGSCRQSCTQDHPLTCARGAPLTERRDI